MKNSEVFLGMGSNLGDRLANLNTALDLLASTPDVCITDVSSIYATSPVGLIDQPDFYNAVSCVRTNLEPDGILALCMEIETFLGRQRTIYWGPRTLDLDILLIMGIEVHTDYLTVPHPRLMERAFVLAPLAQIAPNVVLPDGHTAEQAVKSITGQRIDLLWESDWEQRWRCIDTKQ